MTTLPVGTHWDGDDLSQAMFGDDTLTALVYGYEVEFQRDGGDCKCGEHECYEWTATVQMAGPKGYLCIDDTDADVLMDDLRDALEPYAIDTEEGRQRWQLAENVRRGLQPPLPLEVGA